MRKGDTRRLTIVRPIVLCTIAILIFPILLLIIKGVTAFVLAVLLLMSIIFVGAYRCIINIFNKRWGLLAQEVALNIAIAVLFIASFVFMDNIRIMLAEPLYKIEIGLSAKNKLRREIVWNWYGSEFYNQIVIYSPYDKIRNGFTVEDGCKAQTRSLMKHFYIKTVACPSG